jgi:hypothetical protein
MNAILNYLDTVSNKVPFSDVIDALIGTDGLV